MRAIAASTSSTGRDLAEPHQLGLRRGVEPGEFVPHGASPRGDRQVAKTCGRRSAQGTARSSCAASARRTSSRYAAPTSCTPIGSPPSLVASGTDIAGWPVTLNAAANAAYGVCRIVAIAGSPSTGFSMPEHRRQRGERRGEQHVVRRPSVVPPAEHPPASTRARR